MPKCCKISTGTLVMRNLEGKKKGIMWQMGKSHKLKARYSCRHTERSRKLWRPHAMFMKIFGSRLKKSIKAVSRLASFTAQLTQRISQTLWKKS